MHRQFVNDCKIVTALAVAVSEIFLAFSPCNPVGALGTNAVTSVLIVILTAKSR